MHSRIKFISSLQPFPFVSFDLTSDKGILYGINRHNSSLVLFDRFSLENYHCLFSRRQVRENHFQQNWRSRRTLMFDTDVVVIDPKREYEYLAEATGGDVTSTFPSPQNTTLIRLTFLFRGKTNLPPALLRSNIITLVRIV